jgi:hypothetical protein
MATIAAVSVDEYLSTTCEPDCEYVQGSLQKRSLPDWDHSGWQSALIGWFGKRKLNWDIRVLPSIRIRIAADQFRIPDVTIVSRSLRMRPWLSLKFCRQTTR